jgi:outer membrane protein assembly factor BamB
LIITATMRAVTGEDRRDKLRASGADRQRAAEVLATALREGRLDAREYDNRSRAAQEAKSVGELNQLVADLPSQLGVREWVAHLRIRQADRDQVARWLGDAQGEGRLTEAEHERRLTDLASAGTYTDLIKLVDGVPGPPDAPRDALLVSDLDRQAVLDGLAAALADGMITADEHRDLRASARRARRYRQLDALAIDLGARADPAERARAVRRLDQAHAAGQLDAAEHAKRVGAAQAATRDAELEDLLADLTATSGSRAAAGSLLSLNRRHRLADAEREQAAQELRHALDDGRLTLDEYDERIQKAYAAGTAGELRPLLKDLLAPAAGKPSAATAGQRKSWLIAGATTAAVVAVVTVVAGIVVYRSGENEESGHAPTPTGGAPELGVVWSAPLDRPSDLEGEGSWITDRTVIRARTDRMTAYDLADGHVVWTFPVPADHELCGMSRAIDRNLGLVAYGPEGTYYCPTVAALDLGTGRPLWQRQRPEPTEFNNTYFHNDEIALGGDVAVLREAHAFLAVDARANTQRWRLPVAKGCRPYSVTASGAVAALLTACDDRSAQLAVVDAASGREQWHAPLRLSPDDKSLNANGRKATVVLSVDPVVVRTSDEDGAFISFDSKGKRRATIPQNQPDLDLALGEFPISWTARPGYHTAVLDDVLIVPANKPGQTDTGVAGFSLADGRRLWLTNVPSLIGIGVAAGTVLLTGKAILAEAELRTLSVQDGAVTSTRKIGMADQVGLSSGFDLWTVGDRYIFANYAGTQSPPVTVIGPRP